MALTYWSLQEYDHVPVVRTARRALVRQMRGLGLSQWRAHRHVCENFGPHKDTADCTGDRFYHWGGLAGFIGLVEAGYYQYYQGMTPQARVPGVVVEQA